MSSVTLRRSLESTATICWRVGSERAANIRRRALKSTPSMVAFRFRVDTFICLDSLTQGLMRVKAPASATWRDPSSEEPPCSRETFVSTPNRDPLSTSTQCRPSALGHSLMAVAVQRIVRSLSTGSRRALDGPQEETISSNSLLFYPKGHRAFTISRNACSVSPGMTVHFRGNTHSNASFLVDVDQRELVPQECHHRRSRYEAE